MIDSIRNGTIFIFIIMKQKIIKTDKATLLVVEMPEGVNEYHHSRAGVSLSQGDGSYLFISGNWQILGRLPDITEEQAHSIVDKEFNEMTDEWFYRNYLQDEDYNYTVGESLYSLLQANDVYFETTYPDYDQALKHFETYLYWEAQSKVWDKERTYLFIKVD